MLKPVGVDVNALRSECLPCGYCGGEIDYLAEPGSTQSFIVYRDQSMHYMCAARASKVTA